MKKNIVRLIVDVIMAVLLLMMLSYRLVSPSFHEIGGLVVFGLFLIHIALSWKWVVAVTGKLFGKQIPWRTRLMYLLDVLLLLTVATIILSGDMISKTILIQVSGGNFNWRTLHYFATALALLLAGVHIGLHWPFFKKLFAKINFLPKALSTALSIILLVVILAYGSYSLTSSSFTSWLSGPFSASAAHNFEGDHGGGHGFGGGREALSGDGQNHSLSEAPSIGSNLTQDRGDFGGGQISIGRILGLITTYGSIMAVFAAIAWGLDVLAKRIRRKKVVPMPAALPSE